MRNIPLIRHIRLIRPIRHIRLILPISLATALTLLHAFTPLLHNPTTLANDPLTRAVSYLKSKLPTPWTTMALIAAGETNVPTEHLKTVDTSEAIKLEAPMLAIAAAGHDPRTFAQEDLVTKLKTFHTQGQIGDPGLVNDDIFGILALSAAGEPQSDPAIQDAKTAILAKQQTDGSWGDTNMTAAAIEALIEAGVSANDPTIVRALAWLKSTQNDDGGFPYSWPTNPYTNEPDPSDSSSDAWVAHAIKKSGQDPTSSTWEKNGKDAIDHLITLQQSNGGFAHSQDFTDETSFTPISTAYAVIALAGKSLPVARLPHPLEGGGGGEVSYEIKGSTATVCAGTASLSQELKTAMDIIPAAAQKCGFTYEIVQTSFGPYLKSIGSDTAQGLAGWLYRVNGVLPNIGAADYALKTQDGVLWYYGKFGEEQAVELSVNVLPAPGGGGGSGEGPSMLSFTVEPTSLQFGDLTPGEQQERELTVRNSGNVGISLTSTVHGDALFVDNLQLDHVGWRTFSASLAPAAHRSVNASLAAPSNASAGQKQGMLIFWASAQ